MHNDAFISGGSKSLGANLQCKVSGKPSLYGENNYLYGKLDEDRGGEYVGGSSGGNTPRDHYGQTPIGNSRNGNNEFGMNFNVNVNINFGQVGTQGDPGVAGNSYIHFNKGSSLGVGADGYDPRCDVVKTAQGPFVAGALKKLPTAERGKARASKGHKRSADGKKL